MTTASELLLIGGRSGSGKSTVAWEVSALLQERAVAHAHIEGDFLDQIHPAPADDPDRSAITARNLAAVWGNYAALGCRRLVYCNTVAVTESAMLAAAMGGTVTPIGVLLTAADATAANRLRGREIGGAYDAHVERSARAAAYLEANAPAWIRRVPTDDRTVTDIAAEIVAHTGW
ncbi:MAG: hypothetical protein HOQ43_00335 [Glycomyces artemisiae]|uniref:Uncharacterized protein n=1 Tax=Glycomyces artemisiae TaxID=1076443 RepID=A0A850C6Y3_9ACTN|nr:hypothetical protein [Glycomyces artemisiae]